MKNKKFRVIFSVFILIVLVTTIFSVFAETGDGNDPLVSLSYIQNKVIPEIKEYIDEKFSSLGGGSASFEVVNFKKGDVVLCEKSTELILRMGKARIIASEKGGIADTTAGFDLANGENMPSNHLLIVPLGDGRGFIAEDNVIVMIKGNFSVK